jgi:hypothetical protein
VIRGITIVSDVKTKVIPVIIWATTTTLKSFIKACATYRESTKSRTNKISHIEYFTYTGECADVKEQNILHGKLFYM